MKVPCDKDCKERSATCHSICEKYIKYKREMDRLSNLREEKRRGEKAFVYRKR